MNYTTGESVRLGDRVCLDDDSGGVVVSVIDAEEYSLAYPKAQWSYLKTGVLINFPVRGLIHYPYAMEADVKFIARGIIR